MPKKRRQGPCAVLGCGKPIHTVEWCELHYLRRWKTGRFEKSRSGKKRKHPLYINWHDRKQSGYLCSEWLDFWVFVKDVGEKPSPNHFLVRLKDGKFGPKNFEWRERLRRRPGESKKEWWARKWRSRQEAFPSMERAREMRRRFGITIADYEAMRERQNGVCAICKQPETAMEVKSGTIKRLAVDHCHRTKKIRGLLCWRCNGALGKVEDSTALLHSMIKYLEETS